MNAEQPRTDKDLPASTGQMSPSRLTRLTQTLRKTYHQLIRIHGTPREIALGMALGLFIGMTPLMGIHMAIAVFFATLFGWNKLAAAIGVWITNPLTAIFLYSLTYIIGAQLLEMDKPFFLKRDPDYSLLVYMLHNAPEFLLALTVGGVLLGLPIAIVGYYLTFAAVWEYQEKIRGKLAREREKIVQGVSNLAGNLRRKKGI